MRSPAQTLEVVLQRVRRNAQEVSILRMTGSLDADTAPVARRALDPILDGSADHMVIDLDPVVYLDSTGLMLLTDAFARLSRGRRRLALSTTSDRTLKLFSITGLAKVFTIRANVREALAAVTP